MKKKSVSDTERYEIPFATFVLCVDCPLEELELKEDEWYSENPVQAENNNNTI